VNEQKEPILIDNTDDYIASDTGTLIDHILIRYHEAHRDELSKLHALAERVERVHGCDPQSPKGLTVTLEALWRDMEEHMIKEESILFPAMRAGDDQRIEQPIAVMRNDHNNHAATITLIKRITSDMTPPDHACGSWRTLYAGITKLLEDLEAHITLENNILFPRFEQK